MYTRDITSVPQKLILQGKPVFGTFKGFPQKLDIRGVKAPFGNFPFFTFLTDFRIKSRLFYCFGFESYVGAIEFFDAKIIGSCFLTIWDTKTLQKHTFSAVLPAKTRRVPKYLATKDSCVCLKHSKKIKIQWDRQKNILTLKFNIKTAKKDNQKNHITGLFTTNFTSPETIELTCVLPSPTQKKCNASYKLFCVAKTDFAQKQGQSVCLLDINRTYCKFHTTLESLFFTGFIAGTAVGFMLVQTSCPPENADIFNENFLFKEGKTTPLPPVKITHPYGSQKTWVIQDTESMVDLTFSPLCFQEQKLNALLIKTSCTFICGNIEGFLLDKEGNKLIFKQLPGIAKINDFRL